MIHITKKDGNKIMPHSNNNNNNTLMIFVWISAVVLWSLVLASCTYKLKSFPTPFGDSLSAAQRQLKQGSAQVRGQFFGCAFMLYLLGLGALGCLLYARRACPSTYTCD